MNQLPINTGMEVAWNALEKPWEYTKLKFWSSFGAVTVHFGADGLHFGAAQYKIHVQKGK